MPIFPPIIRDSGHGRQRIVISVIYDDQGYMVIRIKRYQWAQKLSWYLKLDSASAFLCQVV